MPECVPAETAGTLLARRHSAAARCERAELAVHTNSTRRASPSSSWARSQTVMTRSPSCRTSLMWRGRSRGSGRRWRPAAAIAPGSIAAAGWVPADAAGTVLARRHSAAARCERAELAVHTNSTRRAARAAGAASESRAPGISCR